ncbi:hypothetical protein CTAYLR_010190 [Chrysophaeum taylorii]|uniref:ABC transporter n=1 Tax=Chrysophaeum taylorii TaxID=2483200 RepID=A0AAD7U637_9STRA|nr:hypothetical protein CTAYLR_010190 [Chrysophaeum taylorii]
MKSDMGVILAYVWPERFRLAIGSGALVVSAFSNAYAPRAMGRVVDAYARRKESGGAALRRELVTTACVFGIGALASGVRLRLFLSALERSVARLRRDVYRAALKRRSAFFDASESDGRLPPRELAEVVERDARLACATLTEHAQNAVRYCSSVLNGAANLARLNLSLALEVALCVPAAALVLRRAGKASSRTAAVSTAAEARCASRSRECLAHMRFVRAAAAEGAEWARYGLLCDDAADAAARHATSRAIFHGLLDAVAKTLLLGVVARGGASVQNGAMSAGDLLTFSAHAAYLALGLGGLGKLAVAEVAAGRRAATRCAAVLRGPDDKDRGAVALLDGVALEPAAFDRRAPHVELRDVWLAYGRQEPALRGATLCIQRGEVRGLVGASGAGKTSVFGLLLGLYDADSGTVSVAGLDVSKATPPQLAALRASEIATSDQAAAVVFADSLRAALAYPETPDAPHVELAAKLVDLDGFAETLGYDAPLGDKASALSGGQRARVALGRALRRRDASLLLLDEPTAALDRRTEERLLDAVFADARERGLTLLVIAHSTAAMARCDAISVLKGGRIVQTGTYDDLKRDPTSELAILLRQSTPSIDSSP